ncbi:MAG: 2,3-bisphosphoglycerate-independent phosphoglycerate mutase [Candidatus Shapirobacteria bacterium]|jgi:2,3-bisphosphoglycerate-independent phosphoglycerate mutase
MEKSIKKPVVYIILDGWGIAPAGPGNAISLAKTPYMDYLKANYPYTEIGAGGEAIGLWKGHQGASEIGHFIIGAGRNVFLPQNKVANAVSSGEILANKVFLETMDYVKKNNSTLHIAGLMSNSGVHSYDEFIHALVSMAARNRVKNIVVHFITDGRDTPPFEAKVYWERLKEVFELTGVGKVGTVMGRYWIMDRDHRWDRVEKGYRAMAEGKGEFAARSVDEAIESAYKRAKEAKDRGENFVESDEFISPTVIVDENNEPVGKIKDGDALIWANARTDRAIEITQAFTEENFADFDRGEKPNIRYVGTFRYYDEMKAPYAYDKEYPKNTFGEIIAKAGLKQFRVTETEKWIYVTTMFSGMREEPFEGEDRELIPSDKIATYDLQPKMQTVKIAEAAVRAIESGKYALVMMNFNNPDIIGHTGNIPATIIGVEECDKAVEMVVKATLGHGGLAVVSADHGNAEVMMSENGTPETAHSANNVPFMVVDDDPKYKKIKLKKGGAIKDVTPTILEILRIPKPEEMTGESLMENG